MKTLSFLFGCLLSLGVAATVYAEKSTETEHTSLTQLMTAISQDDHEAFIANGTQAFKNNISKQTFHQLSDQLGDQVRKGYTADYVTALYQNGNIVHVWKISYTGSKEQSLMKLMLIDDKVAGFWIL